MTNLPEDSKVFNFIENIDYTDTFSIELTQDNNIKDLYLKLVNTKSKIVEFLMSSWSGNILSDIKIK